MSTDRNPRAVEDAAYAFAFLFGAPWRRNVLRSLDIVRRWYGLAPPSPECPLWDEPSVLLRPRPGPPPCR